MNDIKINDFLNKREQDWPQWNIPNLPFSNLNKDLIYPTWFKGNWLLRVENLNDISDPQIEYKVNFFENESGEIIGNRKNNSESIGKKILGEKLIMVKIDPQSFNNQIIYLSDDEYIESRIIGRNQFKNNQLFFADEFLIQNFHKKGVSRINQVEVMSKFYQCDNQTDKIEYYDKTSICGIQYVASYGSRVGDNNVRAIQTNKYKLNLQFIDN